MTYFQYEFCAEHETQWTIINGQFVILAQIESLDRDIKIRRFNWKILFISYFSLYNQRSNHFKIRNTNIYADLLTFEGHSLSQFDDLSNWSTPNETHQLNTVHSHFGCVLWSLDRRLTWDHFLERCLRVFSQVCLWLRCSHPRYR